MKICEVLRGAGECVEIAIATFPPKSMNRKATLDLVDPLITANDLDDEWARTRRAALLFFVYFMCDVRGPPSWAPQELAVALYLAADAAETE